MAVETRFVVVRNDKEVKTFMNKKDADEHDKMLDIADSLDELLMSSPVELSTKDRESLSFYLAKQKEELLIALQAKKAKPQKKEVIDNPVTTLENKSKEIKEAS